MDIVGPASGSHAPILFRGFWHPRHEWKEPHWPYILRFETGFGSDNLNYTLLAAFVAVRLVDRLANATNVYVHHRACDSKNHRLRVKAFAHASSRFCRTLLSIDRARCTLHSID